MTIYESLGLKKVINASGKMTALGASAVKKEVAEYMAQAAQEYVEIDSLIDKAGEIIASYTGAEDACVTLGAAAGIAISVAACITKGNLKLIEQLPNSEGMPNEIIIQKGHSVNFGAPIVQMVSLGGGKPIEVGQANKTEPFHIEGAINDKTAALLFIKSHHTVQKGMVSFQAMADIAHRNNLPLIVDAAAEEDIKKYYQEGADLVIYSGGKAIGGPTSGFICGEKELISWCKKQYKGIGRAMKASKESIMGLLKAIELYVSEDNHAIALENKKKMEKLAQSLADLKNINISIKQDEAGREIYRAEIKINEKAANITAYDVIEKLKCGNPSIYVRDHYANLGIISIDPRNLKENDDEIIASRLHEILGGKTNA